MIYLFSCIIYFITIFLTYVISFYASTYSENGKLILNRDSLFYKTCNFSMKFANYMWNGTRLNNIELSEIRLCAEFWKLLIIFHIMLPIYLCILFISFCFSIIEFPFVKLYSLINWIISKYRNRRDTKKLNNLPNINIPEKIITPIYMIENEEKRIKKTIETLILYDKTLFKLFTRKLTKKQLFDKLLYHNINLNIDKYMNIGICNSPEITLLKNLIGEKQYIELEYIVTNSKFHITKKTHQETIDRLIQIKEKENQEDYENEYGCTCHYCESYQPITINDLNEDDIIEFLEETKDFEKMNNRFHELVLPYYKFAFYELYKKYKKDFDLKFLQLELDDLKLKTNNEENCKKTLKESIRKKAKMRLKRIKQQKRKILFETLKGKICPTVSIK